MSTTARQTRNIASKDVPTGTTTTKGTTIWGMELTPSDTTPQASIPTRTVDVSGLGNNCGLFALSLGLKFALDRNPQLKDSLSKEVFDLVSNLSSNIFTQSKLLQQLGQNLRKQLFAALQSSPGFRETQKYSFIEAGASNLEGSNVSPEHETLIQNVEAQKFLDQVKIPWKAAHKILDQQFNTFQAAYEKTLQSAKESFKKESFKKADLTQLREGLRKLLADRASEKEVVEFIHKHLKKLQELNTNASATTVAMCIRWIFTLAHKATDHGVAVGENLAYILDKTIEKIIMDALKNEFSLQNLNMNNFVERVCWLALCQETSFKSVTSHEVSKKSEIITRIRNLLITFFLDKGIGFEKIYDSYCIYSRDNKKMITADELGILAHQWHMQLIVNFTNGLQPYRSPRLDSQEVLKVTLSNRSRLHWQIEVPLTEQESKEQEQEEIKDRKDGKEDEEIKEVKEGKEKKELDDAEIGNGNSASSSSGSKSVNSSDKMQLESLDLITVSNTLRDKNPEKYLMSHLLACGFRGGVYQLLVLLLKVAQLLNKKVPFTATMESSGFGNLDDVILRIFDSVSNSSGKKIIKRIEAYQAKHYDDPITIDLFFNKNKPKKPTVKPSKKKGKNTKMHIGKFFDGWLSLINECPNLSGDDLRSIIFCNNGVDDTLQSCIANGKFKADFIQQKTRINVTYNKAQTDLYQLLYEQAWKYIGEQSEHTDKLKLKDTEKKKLFNRFLASVDFQIKQPNMENLIKAIIKDISGYLQSPGTQVFLCLFFAVMHWFTDKYKKKQVPILDRALLEDLLKKAQAQSRDLLFLQCLTEKALSAISYVIAGTTIPRLELKGLNTLLAADTQGKTQCIMIVGEKGMGKSGLTKQLFNQYDPNKYLFLSALDLVQNADNVNRLKRVWESIDSVSVVVIDAAENLLLLKEDAFKALVNPLLKSSAVGSNRNVLFTLTSEASKNSLFSRITAQKIVVRDLDLNQVMNSYPVLAPYKSLGSWMRIAQKPFYLSSIIQLLNQMGRDQFEQMVRHQRVANELLLMRQVVEGRDESLAQSRRQAWQVLAFQIFNTQKGVNQGIPVSSISPGLACLIKEGIVVVRDKLFSFEHDLFFDNAMMTYLFQNWENHCIQGKSAEFWVIFAEQCKIPAVRTLFEKWLLLHHTQLKEDIVSCKAVITKFSCFDAFLTIAIISNQNDLLETLLKERTDLKTLLNTVLPNLAMPLVSFAILYDNAQALAILFKLGAAFHHPSAKLRYFEGGTVERIKEKPEIVKIMESLNNAVDSDSENDEDKEEEDEEGYEIDQDHSEDEEEENQRSINIVEEIKSKQEQAQAQYDARMRDFILHCNKYWSFYHEKRSAIGYNDLSWEVGEHLYQDANPQNDLYYIHFAAQHNKWQCVQFLIQQKKGMLTLYNDCEELPIHTAALNGANKVVEGLAKARAGISSEDYFGETPLHNATYKDDLVTAQILLVQGANPNDENSLGLTPCHIALARLDLNMISLFLAYGGDFTCDSGYGSFLYRISLANFLDEVYERNTEVWGGTLNDFGSRFNAFIIELIRLLNYGVDNSNFIWGSKCGSTMDSDLRKKHLNQVQELMSFVDHFAQLSPDSPGFDYYNQETEFEYALKVGNIEHLKLFYMLEDQDRIARAFAKFGDKMFELDRLNIFLKHFFWYANWDEMINNLKTFAQKHNNSILLKKCKTVEDEIELLKKESKEEEDDSEEVSDVDEEEALEEGKDAKEEEDLEDNNDVELSNGVQANKDVEESSSSEDDKSMSDVADEGTNVKPTFHPQFSSSKSDTRTAAPKRSQKSSGTLKIKMIDF